MNLLVDFFSIFVCFFFLFRYIWDALFFNLFFLEKLHISFTFFFLYKWLVAKV